MAGRPRRKQSKATHTGIWCLDTPLELTADDELKIVVHTDRAGCIRLSVSPFGFDPRGRGELDDEDAPGPGRETRAAHASPGRGAQGALPAGKGGWLADLERGQAALSGHPGLP